TPMYLASPAAQNLPAEVVDHILDGNRGDRRSLTSSSLVCKAWLPSSRYHLFSEFDVYVGKKFLKLLHHPLCTFIYCIRTITLYLGQPDASGIVALDDEVVTRLAKLMHVSSLRILNHRGLIAKPTLALLASTFGGVETLRLENAFASANDVIEFVASFPKLKTLDFYPYCHGSTPATFPSTLPPSKLSRVQLHGPFFDRSWFVEHPAHISALALTNVKSNDLGKVEELLTALAPDLRDLSMNFVLMEIPIVLMTNAGPLHVPGQTALDGPELVPILQHLRLTSLQITALHTSISDFLVFTRDAQLPTLRMLSWIAQDYSYTKSGLSGEVASIDEAVSDRTSFEALEEVYITVQQSASYLEDAKQCKWMEAKNRLALIQFPKADGLGIKVVFQTVQV
ncbi:hypothetical protein B0H16DRAFT_1529024, partial [Mycena metata]